MALCNPKCESVMEEERREGRKTNKERKWERRKKILLHFMLLATVVEKYKINKWISYKYCWPKHLQHIINLYSSNICFFCIGALSFNLLSSLSPIQSVFHIIPDNYSRNKIITLKQGWQYVCKFDLGQLTRHKIK